MKKYLLITVLGALLVLPGHLGAQTSTTSDPTPLPPIRNTDPRKENREAVREKREAFIQETKEKREALQEKRKEVFGNLKDRRNELEEQIKTKREALKTEITAIKKERVSARKSFVENRFSQVIIVLTNAQDRLDKKIAELEGTYDMTEAKTHLEKSKTSLAEAKKLLETLKTTTVSDTDETTATKPRETAKQIEKLLQETRQHLVDTIHAMKNAVNPDTEDEDDDQDETATTAS